MGGYISKLLYQEEHYKTNELNATSLILENRDTCTPQPQKRKSIIDPRSATLGITRTPIEVISTPQKELSNVASSVPKHLRRKPYLETNFDSSPPSLTLEKYLDPRSPSVDVPRTPITVEPIRENDTPKHVVSHQQKKTNLLNEMHQKMLRLDPRSPATNFDRTPILKPKTLEMRKTYSEENLNTITKIKKQSSRLSYCETVDSFNVSEIATLPDIVTDLNISQKLNKTTEESGINSSGSASNNSVVTVVANRKQASLDNSLENTSLDSPLKLPQIEEKIENFEENLIAKTDKIIDNVLHLAMIDFENKFSEAENKFKVWRDNLSPNTQEDSEYDGESESESASEIVTHKEEIVIEYDDDEYNVKGTIKKTEFNIKKSSLAERRKHKTSRKEMEAKRILSPILKPSNEVKKLEVMNNRTPLSNRSNSNSKSKGMDLKSPYLRNKALLSSTKLHQENTPPRVKKSGFKSKLNKTKWDGDSTIII